jgi:hypothetical protein
MGDENAKKGKFHPPAKKPNDQYNWWKREGRPPPKAEHVITNKPGCLPWYQCKVCLTQGTVTHHVVIMGSASSCYMSHKGV